MWSARIVGHDSFRAKPTARSAPPGRRVAGPDVMMGKSRSFPRVRIGVLLLALLIAAISTEASTLCAANQKVQAGSCISCETGDSNAAGDVTTAGDTACDGSSYVGTDGTWEQVDNGVMVNENGFARNVSMSSDGTRVAVIYRDGLATPANGYTVAKGIVIVYEYNANAASGSQWQQLGTNVIETDTAGDG